MLAYLPVPLFILMVLCMMPPTLLQEGPPEPTDMPGIMPKAVRTKTAMVSAAHPLAAKIGVDLMKSGGNAIDATVAVQMALNVVEPQSSGIGGGCFLLYYDAAEKKTYCIDGREETPAHARRGDFLGPDGKVLPDAMTGCRAAGVPGTVAAMCLAHQRWGKLPLNQVMEPAIQLAERGIGVTPRLREAITDNLRRFHKIPSSRKHFLDGPEGHVPEIGTVLKFPDLARTLRRIAKRGPEGFYQGETAELIVKTSETCSIAPGRITKEDLLNYRAVYREPLRVNYNGHVLVGFPPPSSGTITLGLMLNYWESLSPTQRVLQTSAGLDEWARAECMAFADRNVYLGDQDWSDDPMPLLLDPARLADRRLEAGQLKPGQLAKPGPRPGRLPATKGAALNPSEGEHTTHFSIVDPHRNVVACTTTIEHGMGCGVVVPGGGFLLNNELTDFDLHQESGPNALDASRRPRKSALTENTLLAGKRPRSSMTPLIVFEDGKPVLTLGSPGGSQIIGIVGQTLVHVLDRGLDMQEAINAPRSSCRNGPLTLESLFKNHAELSKQLTDRGWKVLPNKSDHRVWGGAHGIRLLPDGSLEGGADPRREGAVRGW
jgi:gamma-glutamyltranspeptidase/glutathione hydrolase